jgi:hypothetical protein
MSNDFSHSATALSFFCLKEHSTEFHATLLSCLIKKKMKQVQECLAMLRNQEYIKTLHVLSILFYLFLCRIQGTVTRVFNSVTLFTQQSFINGRLHIIKKRG